MKKEEVLRRTREDLLAMGIDNSSLEIITQEFGFTDQWLKDDAYKVGHVFRENGSKTYRVLLYYSTKMSQWVTMGEDGRLKTKETKWLNAYNNHSRDIKRGKEIVSKGLPIYLSKKKIEQAGYEGSFGEQVVQIALKELGLYKSFKVEKEYSITKLKGYKDIWVGTPRYDFAIIDTEENKPVMFIEFDGQQHHKQVNYYDRDFQLTVLRDAAKNAYAFYSLIPLIRIPNGVLDMKNSGVDVVKNIILTYLQTNSVIN